MSSVSGFNNIRTTTTLGVSALITLAAVMFMAYAYYTNTQNSEQFQERSFELYELDNHINQIRSSVQWVYSYENDLLMERSKYDVLDGIYFNWEKVNIFYRRNHMVAALDAAEQIPQYLRSEEDVALFEDLYTSLQAQFKRLEEESARNQENSKIAEESMDKSDTSILAQVDETVSKVMEKSISVLYALDTKLRRLEELEKTYQAADKAEATAVSAQNAKYFYISVASVFAALLLSMLLFRGGIQTPLKTLMDTINGVRSGDDEARTGLKGRSELGQLGSVLDELLDEKDATLKEQQRDREALNASVIALIQNVFKLSQRDLTIRVPVAEDITGAVSDSINQLADSIDTTLHDVTFVSQGVNEASTQILSQSAKVMEHNSKEQEEVKQALEELNQVIRAMQLIAQLATSSHNTSKQAITTSENAMTSVSETINSINRIRQTISEAEKRIKRLGERSQEIGGIVSLINNISERTHVLSLNASMHAASAGEAGRGLTVVVDEVQRLAENSREATAEIETLVNNIQLETNDTIEVINQVITEVVKGTRLAEEAGERMGSTREATNSLVESVVRIAKSAVHQSKVAKQLHERASSISQTTSETSEELQRQTELSAQLVQAAEKLQESVSVFQLTKSEIETPQ